jgi:D-alanyl-lipoteichoic acid acyltransferase DltB (MBOAT superfamily)
MLFCDPKYFALFLPIAAFLYWFSIGKSKFRWPLPILLIASTVFYATWSVKFFALLVLSACINYTFGYFLLTSEKKRTNKQKLLLISGILFNVGLLGYFKYFNFFVDNCNRFFGTQWYVAKIILPLGISFYTFQQLAYLVDAYKRTVARCSLGQYILFVIFFPQLVAGPIVHYQEMIPQFGKVRVIDWESMYRGITIFVIGLAKKILIADTLATYVQDGYAHVDQLAFISAWIVSLCYTFQLYFDFSGYADMAVGSGLLFGIRLPENFNSPYQALDIQDFWRRWHMTLSTWLKNYIYIPLGGNRCSQARTCVNLFLTFFIGGIWHGAGWGFIVWGTLHGLATLVHRLWQLTGIHFSRFTAWLITFNFINIAWIFFRAESLSKATTVLRKMFDLSCLNGVNRSTTLQEVKHLIGGILFSGNQCLKLIFVCCALTLLCLCFKNAQHWTERLTLKPSFFKTCVLSLVVWFSWAIMTHRADKIEFLYWQF